MTHNTEPLRGKIVVITGASSGIGAEAARQFAGLGATVAVVGRSADKTGAVAQRIGGRPFPADFTKLDEVRDLAADLLACYERIDILANNAGAIFAARTLSTDGHELTFQVNYLAPFLLTNLLLPRLTGNPAGARVINTGSNAYKSARLDLEDLDGSRRERTHRRAYPESKLATILFTAELAARTRGTGTVAMAFHPGLVVTDIARDSPFLGGVVNSWLGRTMLAGPGRGAEPLLHLATVADPADLSGRYFSRLMPVTPAGAQARDPDVARRLWERSVQLTGLPDEAPAGI